MHFSIEPFQIIIALLTIFLLFRSIVKYVEHKKTVRELILSIVFWGSATIFALYPNFIDETARKIGFDEGVNAVFAFILFIISYIVFNLVIQSDKNEVTVTKIVREIALEKLKNRKSTDV